MSADSQWLLTSRCGIEFALPQTMIFLGREECDVTLQSRSVDKRHAVITFDHYEKCFKVKDLNSINGTYVNDMRIPGQTYMKLEHMDAIRFGYDPNEFKIQRINHSSTAATSSSIANTSLSKRLSPENSDGSAMEKKGGVQEKIGSCTYEPQKLPDKILDHCHVLNDIPMAIGAGDSLSNSSIYCFGDSFSAPNDSAFYCDDKNKNQSCMNKEILGNSLCHVTLPPTESGQQQVLSSIASEVSSSVEPAQLLPSSTLSDSVITAAATKLASSEIVAPINILSSAKHILESTSSNASLHSAFSGDSLDQLNDSAVGVGSDHMLDGCKQLEANGSSTTLSGQQLTSSSSSVTSTKEGEGNSVTASLVGCVKAEESCNNPCQSISSTCLPLHVEDLADSVSAKEDQKAKQKALPTAFTIEFDNLKTSSKKLDIKDSISKFAPPKENEKPNSHRRNHSLSKVDENKIPLEGKLRSCETSPEQSYKKAIYGVYKGVNAIKRGYHSEGYFSSDQDDDMSAKSDRMLSSSTITGDRIKNKSKENGNLNSSAAFLINKMLSSNEKEACIQKPTVLISYEEKKTTNIVSQDLLREQDIASTLNAVKENAVRPSVLDVKSSILEDLDFLSLSVQSEINNQKNKKKGSDDIKDNVSESGTYTIEKESPNLELEEARRNIDKIFGITHEETEEAVITGPQRLLIDSQEIEHVSPESDSSKSKSDSISKQVMPVLMKEWTAHESRPHTSSPVMEKTVRPKTEKFHSIKKDNDFSDDVSHPVPCIPSSLRLKTSSPEGSQRPRRKLPTPPVDKLPFSIAQSRNIDAVEIDTGYYTNSIDSKFSHTSAVQSGSEMTYDTEKLLKETETVVTAMEARMDQCKAVIMPLGSSLESRDSGGESDIDTSTASYYADKKSHKQEKNISKRLNTQIKAKYKAFEESRRSPPATCDKRTSHASGGGKGQTRSRNVLLNQEQAGSDNASECETASIASDVSSSSDISGSSPRTRRRNSEKVPPAMKFNRAFSLRRARLGYSSDSASDKPLPSVPVSHDSKGKGLEGRRTESNKNRPSTASAALSRSDGGRFSLRMGKLVKSSSSSGPTSRTAKGDQHRPSNSNSLRSNSTMSAKEAEMKNWRRRKEYDPMKAAAEGRKKEAAKKAPPQKTDPASNSCHPSSNFQRSASFHGTEGLRMHRNTYTSEDDMTRSLEDDEVRNSRPRHKHGRVESCRQSEQNLLSSQQVIVKPILNNDEYPEDGYRSQNQSEALWGSPPIIRSNQMNSYRHKMKLEALDSLVISTVHQLSSKLCCHTESLIKKLRDSYKLSVEKSQSVEDLLEILSAPDTPTSPATRSTSRELAGILKNLKKLEKGLQVIDKLKSEDEVPTDCALPKHKVGCNGLPDK